MCKGKKEVALLYLLTFITYCTCITDCTNTCTIGADSKHSYFAGIGNPKTGDIFLQIKDPLLELDVYSRILIVQMKGGEGFTYDTTNTESFGQIINLGSIGFYEFNFVTSINPSCTSGESVIRLNSGLTNNYLSDGQSKYQVVAGVYCNTVSITGNIQCTPWDGEKGGLIVIEAVTLTLTGSKVIQCSGSGFRGGYIVPPAGCTNPLENFPLTCSTPLGGMKGESWLPNSNAEYCRSAFGSGGGGAPCNGTALNTAGLGAAGGSLIGMFCVFPGISRVYF